MKVKIIYILGYGHSGSTLLNLILGSTKKTFSAGELIHIRKRMQDRSWKGYKINKNQNLCDCGAYLKDCIVWREVIKQVSFERIYNHDLTIRSLTQAIRLYLFPQKNSYFDDYNLYNKILEESKKIKPEATIVVDSSKNLRRLLYLVKNEKLDINIIRLVRDGRAVVRSMEKRDVNWIKTVFLWITKNCLEALFLKRISCPKLNLSYDLFAQDPEKYIMRINKKFNLDIDTKNYIKNVNKEEFHNFSGNAMRQKKLTEIKYDQKWRKEMPKWKQMILSVLCYIPNRIWVYNENN